MKYLGIALILFSFIPLQMELPCSILAHFGMASECQVTTERQASKEEASAPSVKTQAGQLVHEGMTVDEETCEKLTSQHPATLSAKQRMLADANCQQPTERFLLPLDIFLQPFEQRSAPEPTKEKFRHIISFHPLRALYSLFLS